MDVYAHVVCSGEVGESLEVPVDMKRHEMVCAISKSAFNLSTALQIRNSCFKKLKFVAELTKLVEEMAMFVTQMS